MSPLELSLHPAPILAAVFYAGSAASVDTRNAVHKEVGRLIADT